MQQALQASSDIIAKTQANGAKYDGFMGLYKAACLENDAAKMEQYRAMITELLGAILDDMATQYMLMQQVKDLAAGLGQAGK